MNELDIMLRAQFWTSIVSAQVGFSHHPGTTRDAAKPRSRSSIIEEADMYLAEFDKRFHVKQED